LYNLFVESTRAMIWDDVGGSSFQSGMGVGLSTPIAHTVYGRLFGGAPNDSQPDGPYVSTINVTIVY
jgi:spore coat protein U-like protein